ncbi:hypothetical protein ACFFW8_11615 [Erwinia tracheiphila]
MLSRAARHRGVLITSNAQGDLVFTTASKNRAGTLILGPDGSDKDASGTRMLSVKTHQSWAERFSLFASKVVAVAAGYGERPKRPARQRQCMLMWQTLISPAIARPLLLLMTTSPKLKVMRGEAGSRSAQWPMPPPPLQRYRTGFNPQGKLWSPNQLVTVRARAAGFPERDLLITTVTFNLTQEGGTVTELELMPREGFRGTGAARREIL